MAREYKDSGIEWIGRIPKDWKVIPHKRLMRKIKELCPEYKGEDIISLTMNGVIVRDLNAGGKMPTTFDGYQYVHPGNLLMCLFDIDVTPRCVGLIRNEGLTSPAYSQFVLYEGVYGPYYNYLLRYMDDEKCLLHLSKNLRSSLTEDDFGQIPTVFPSLFEQKKIADYLDEKCGEIDSLISLQEKMITQLTDYKQSIITEAVTKGLDPNAQLVPAGIDWIGDIPKGWKFVKIKQLINLIESGVSVNAGNVPAKADEYGVLKTSSVSKYEFIASENKTVNENEKSKVACPVKKGTIIVSRMNTPELVGACGFVERDYNNIFLPDRLWQVHFKNNNVVKFLWFALRSAYIRNYYSSLSVGTSSSMQNISQDQFSNAKIILPSYDEQSELASYLVNKCAEIDALITLKQQKIETLKDYKKSLIYEAVTGKFEI